MIDSIFSETANNWYTNQLTEPFRVNFRNGFEKLKQWCDALEIRFRDSPGKSSILLENIWYNIKNVKARKNPTDYMSVIVFNAKNTGIAIDEAIQVLLIYEYMDVYLKRDLPRVSISSPVVGLIEKFRHLKNILFDIYGNRYYKLINKNKNKNK